MTIEGRTDGASGSALDAVLASLELMRPRMRFSADERVLARLFAHQIGLAIRAFGAHGAAGERDGANGTLELGVELESALGAERQAARQLRALYEISRSFAQTLSLETTLEAVARTVVELLEVDAAVIRMPDERRELLVSRAIHVADPRLDEAGRGGPARPPPPQKLLRPPPFPL